ncbi:unnamed protein product [Alopecurus aequalis]
MEAPLPDDVLLEILVCLNDAHAALFRCATACKRWHGLIADPSFLHRCWPPGSPSSSSIQGFFHRGMSRSSSTCFVPAPRSALGGGCRALSSFVPSAPAGLLDGTMLASRHGLLLLTGCSNTAQLTVCNTITGTFDLLPPLEWDCIQCIGHAILTGVDCRRPLPYYKVLVVDTQLNVYMFSSDEASWSRMSTEGSSAGMDMISPYVSDAIVRCGTAHWLYRNFAASCFCTMNVNLETGHVSTMKLAKIAQSHDRPCGQPWLSLAADGNRTLSVLWMQIEHFQVEIWKRQDNINSMDEEDGDKETSKWHRSRVIELKKPYVDIKRMFILGEKCGTLLVKDDRKHVYFAHLETGIMEEVMDYGERNLAEGDVMAFEMDWATFFVSRLGGR